MNFIHNSCRSTMIKLHFRSIQQSLYTSSYAKCLPCDLQKNSGVVRRHIHVSSSTAVGRSTLSIYEPNRRGTREHDHKYEKLSTREHIRRGSKMFIPEVKKWLYEMKEYFAQDVPKNGAPRPNIIDKYFEFNGPASLADWCVSTDSDFDGGSSTANLEISPSGSGLFTGNLSTDVPKTGRHQNAGYVNLRYNPPLKSFARDYLYEFSCYTYLVIRLRGDGRTYMINLHPDTYFDFEWLNLHSYVLHTRGGPYWQVTKIPFSKFFLHYKGRIQDKQYPIQLGEIKNISITLMDKNNGPFSLEIDYIGCEYDPNHLEEFAYESYHVPKWHART